MPNSLLITIFIISVLGSAFAFAYIISLFKQDISVIKAGIFGITGYFFLYVLISSVLFFFDFYSISKAVLICFVPVIGFSVFSLIKIKKFKKIKFSKKELIFFLAIVLSAVLLSGNKFGFFGMGQDQGVYQTKAIELIHGNNSNVLNFDYALKALSDPDDYTFFRDKVRELQGYYLVGQTEPFYADETAGGDSGLEGVYHGLPTWPAILALFGRMFGMSNMQQCQTVFFICYLMLVFYIFENFKIKTPSEIVAVMILGVTPTTLWVSKSALTEMFLAVIIAAFVYLVCHEDKNARLFIWIPVAVFSVFHISAYTMMPILIICGWIIIASDNRKRAVLSSLLMFAGYFWGFVFSVRLAMLYTVHNYLKPVSRIFGSFDYTSVGSKELIIGISIIVIIFIAITLIISVLLRTQKNKKLIDKIGNYEWIIIKVTMLLVLLLSILVYAKNNKGEFLNPNMNLVAISFAGGIIGFPLIIVGIAFWGKEKIKSIPTLLLCLIFEYIILWATFLRPRIPQFYYYGRYDVPYLLLMVVVLFVIYRDLNKMTWIPVLCMSSVFVYLHHDFVIVKFGDDTRVEWSTVENELEKERFQNSAVIVNSNTDVLLKWMLTLKAAGIDSYPKSDDLTSQTEKLSQFYDNIYFLCEKKNDLYVEDNIENGFVPLYTYPFKYSEIDDDLKPDSWTGYPEFVDEKIYYLQMYLYSEK